MRRSASEIINELENRIAKLERSANPNSPLAKKIRKLLPEGISVSVRRGTKGHNEIHLSWNPNNIYSDFDMTEDDYDFLGENDLSTNELRIALNKAERTIRQSVRDSVIEQDRRRTDMDQGLIVYNLL